MKILFLNEMMNSGSVSFFIREKTALELANQGYQVTMISPSLECRLFDYSLQSRKVKFIFTSGLLPYRFRRGGFGFFDMISKIINIFANRYSIIHVTAGHRPAQFIPAILSKIFFKTKIVDEWWEWYGKEGRGVSRNTLIGKLIGFYDDLFEIRLKRFYDFVIPISSYLKERLILNGFPMSKIEVLFGSIDSNLFVNYSVIEARAKLGLETNSVIIGLISVGESDHEDNKIFIESFIELIKNNKAIYLFVTGESKYIQNVFKEYIGSNVIYKGWLDFEHYNLHLCSCTYFALPLNPIPRNLGRWPHKFSEFVYLERPIIMINTEGDQSDIVKKYNIGFLLNSESNNFYEEFCSICSSNIQIESDHFEKVKSELTIIKRVEKISGIYMRLHG